MTRSTLILLAASFASCTGPSNADSVRGPQRYTFALVSNEAEFVAQDFVEDERDDHCDQPCDGNSVPSVDPPIFVVNSEIVGQPNVRRRDDFAVFVGFSDVDCNLSCGVKSESFTEPRGGGDAAGSLPGNLPCSTADSDVFLRITPAGSPLDAGRYSYSVWLEDQCGGRSDVRTVEFELQ